MGNFNIIENDGFLGTFGNIVILVLVYDILSCFETINVIRTNGSVIYHTTNEIACFY